MLNTFLVIALTLFFTMHIIDCEVLSVVVVFLCFFLVGINASRVTECALGMHTDGSNYFNIEINLMCVEPQARK